MTQAEFDTIQAMTSAQLRHRLDDSTLNNETIAVIDAELSRREQAQHTDAMTQDELIRSNRELYDLLNAAHSRWDDVYAESQRRGARIIELERDNERLRAALAALVLIAEDATHRSKDQYTPDSYARRCAAIEAAKEATK